MNPSMADRKSMEVRLLEAAKSGDFDTVKVICAKLCALTLKRKRMLNLDADRSESLVATESVQLCGS